MFLRRPANPYEGQAKSLTADEQAQLLQSLKADIQHAHTLCELVTSSGDLHLGLPYLALSLKESELANQCATLGIELDTATQRNERYAALRKANERIRELELQLGAKANVEHTVAQLKQADKLLRDWWGAAGLGHVSEITFYASGGVYLKLSCFLSSSRRLYRSDSATPVTDKAKYEDWLTYLKSKGFDLIVPDGEHFPSLLDTEDNRDLLYALIVRALPSAQLIKTENHFDGTPGSGTLNGVEVFVPSLADVLALPTHQKQS